MPPDSYLAGETRRELQRKMCQKQYLHCWQSHAQFKCTVDSFRFRSFVYYECSSCGCFSKYSYSGVKSLNAVFLPECWRCHDFHVSYQNLWEVAKKTNRQETSHSARLYSWMKPSIMCHSRYVIMVKYTADNIKQQINKIKKLSNTIIFHKGCVVKLNRTHLVYTNLF